MGCSCSARRQASPAHTMYVAHQATTHICRSAPRQAKRRRNQTQDSMDDPDAEEPALDRPALDPHRAAFLPNSGGNAPRGESSGLAQRMAYFDKKCLIRSSLNDQSSPIRNGDQEHHQMVRWTLDDSDIAANFWVQGPPQPRKGLVHEDILLGWNELDDGKFADPMGSLTLSNKQYYKIHAWKRISELEVPYYALSESKEFSTLVSDDDGRPMRPGEPLKARIMAENPKAVSIRQGFVGDCSFLSSLASLAEYAARTSIKVLRPLLYPQDNQGCPIINPHGMYGCKLYFNGSHRKVVVDDFVPVKKDGRVLSAHTVNQRDMWVTLLEKAFIRLSGGAYYMHGSNPGSDLFHLTGWLPETVPFKKETMNRSSSHAVSGSSRHQDRSGGKNPSGGKMEARAEVRAHVCAASGPMSKSPSARGMGRWDAVWQQMYRGFVGGTCVVCLGTSEVADSAPSGLEYVEGVSMSSGIVARHAYAVIRMVEHGPLKLVLVRNPWSVIRWKLSFCPGDPCWTPELERLCGYNSSKAAEVDDGCFWIRWEDIILWFSHVYICWNSNCLRYRISLDDIWGDDVHLQESLLPDDTHLILYNPQFRFKVCPVFAQTRQQYKELQARRQTNPEAFVVTVWVLLSRHLQLRNRDAHQRYIACHVYRGNRRQICGNGAVHQGIYSNGECVLLRLDVLRPVVLGNAGTTIVWTPPTPHNESTHTSNNYHAFHPSNNEDRSLGRTGGAKLRANTEASSNTADMASYGDTAGYVDVASCGGDAASSGEMVETTTWSGLERCILEPNFVDNSSVDEITGSNTQYLDDEEHVLVVSQYGQKSTFKFTLRMHANLPIAVRQLPPLIPNTGVDASLLPCGSPVANETTAFASKGRLNPNLNSPGSNPSAYQSAHQGSKPGKLWQTIRINDQWNRSNSGGCSNDLWEYFRNPHYRLEVPVRCRVIIVLETPADVSVGLRLFTSRFASPRALRTCTAYSSGSYRQNACCLDLRLNPGEYTLIPSTFSNNQFVKYQITCHLDIPDATLNTVTEKLRLCTASRGHSSVLPDGRCGNEIYYHGLCLMAIPYPFCKESRFVSEYHGSSMLRLFALKPVVAKSPLSVRLQVHDRSLSGEVWPSLTVLCVLRGPRQAENDLGLQTVDWARYGRLQALRQQDSAVVGVLTFSDIEGGLSADAKTPSSAAARLYTKYNIVCISSVSVYGPPAAQIEYYLYLSPVPAEYAQARDRPTCRADFWNSFYDTTASCSYTLSIMGLPNHVQIRELFP
ncbi:calpain [Gregarina niphandrodes]|uniref:Calpain n=1 Tax=Gregarina niphandrodes TaxID=110365 RepID=A0A023B009_GRENI|nr:calpain [Gregarina niphandrodes]EZG44776.1 calpain [Gregarina niphandrodes]|eukprot:XP_011132668.1 calpain [Gregarina niphandrodes]